MAIDVTAPAGTADFLGANGWGGADVAALAGDASFRRYFRVSKAGRSAILMDAPPPQENPRPFVDVACWLHERGFAAPAILAADLDRGLVLIEDFGDVRMRETVDADSERRAALYRSAVDLLIDLHRHPAGPLRPYDRTELEREAGLFVEWYCPAVGIAADQTSYRAAWHEALGVVADHAAPVTVLRDYHAENLMLLGGGDALGLLDFQDALAGHRAYDLVSLLQDARRDVEPEIEASMLAHYCRATGAGDEFRRRLSHPRRAAECEDHRHLHAAVEARRQAALRSDVSARVALSGARSGDGGAGPGARVVRPDGARRAARRPDGNRRPMSIKRTLAIRPDPGGTVPETAMVMAAGLGKRMRPLTATRPKPLIAVAGQPLLDHVFDRLRAAGVKRAIVNVHYLADALEAHLKNRVKGIDVVVF